MQTQGIGTPKSYVAAAVVAAAAVAGFAACLQFQLPGPGASIAIDDFGVALAALLAGGAAVYAAIARRGNIRLAWSLLAVSALSWGSGKVIWSVYEVALQQAVPYPGWSDVGFLLAVPFAVAGIRAFWSAPRDASSRWRVWLDGTIIALALAFSAWVLGLSAVWHDADEPLLERALDLAYPIGDILIGTVLILALRRATRRRAGRILVLLGGIATNGVTDSAFAYLNATGSHTVHGSILDAGWVIGYVMVAFTAVWPRSPAREAGDRAPVDLWQLVLPWLTVLGAGLSSILVALRGQTLDSFLTGLTGVGASLLTITMVLASRDFLRMLVKSHASEATLSEVIAQAPAGMVRIDTGLRIVDANPRFLALVESSNADTKGALVTRFFTTRDGLEFAAALERVSAGDREAVEGDGEALRATGTKAWVHWSATAVRGPEGATDYFIAMFEDTTAHHDAEAAGAANLELMRRLNAVKTEFLQNVSHEFKTALIGIQGFSEFMRDADQLDVNDARAFAADIHRDAERLDRMVDEMLALDRVETGRAALEVQEVDLRTAISAEVELLRRQVHGNVVSVDLDPDLPTVVGDSSKLSEVVRTLMDNAVKRSPEGATITVRAHADGSGVEVSVEDEGMGAHIDFDQRLFGKDDLYANNPIRKVVGTALAMGIARQIVEMHGGRFWVTGGGAESHFTIPVLWRDRQEAVALTGESRVA